MHNMPKHEITCEHRSSPLIFNIKVYFIHIQISDETLATELQSYPGAFQIYETKQENCITNTVCFSESTCDAMPCTRWNLIRYVTFYAVILQVPTDWTKTYKNGSRCSGNVSLDSIPFQELLYDRLRFSSFINWFSHINFSRFISWLFAECVTDDSGCHRNGGKHLRH